MCVCVSMTLYKIEYYQNFMIFPQILTFPAIDFNLISFKVLAPKLPAFDCILTSCVTFTSSRCVGDSNLF